MRRSTAELNRAIECEMRAIKEDPPSERFMHEMAVDILRWARGDAGTLFDQVMKQRNAVVKMTAGGVR